MVFQPTTDIVKHSEQTISEVLPASWLEIWDALPVRDVPADSQPHIDSVIAKLKLAATAPTALYSIHHPITLATMSSPKLPEKMQAAQVTEVHISHTSNKLKP
jgi:hypothetical protein